MIFFRRGGSKCDSTSASAPELKWHLRLNCSSSNCTTQDLPLGVGSRNVTRRLPLTSLVKTERVPKVRTNQTSTQAKDGNGGWFPITGDALGGRKRCATAAVGPGLWPRPKPTTLLVCGMSFLVQRHGPWTSTPRLGGYQPCFQWESGNTTVERPSSPRIHAKRLGLIKRRSGSPHPGHIDSIHLLTLHFLGLAFEKQLRIMSSHPAAVKLCCTTATALGAVPA